jgi:putative acetyltransferase
MNGISIRTLRPADNATLANIIRTTLTEFGVNKPGTVYDDPTTDHLSELFLTPNSIYYVAELHGSLVGGAGIYPSNGLPPGVCELVKMYLLPSARSLGLGKELISRAVAFAREAGYKHIYLESFPELQQALKVYEKFGFRYLDAPMGNTGHYACDRWMMLDL